MFDMSENNLQILNENKTSMNYWAHMIKKNIDENDFYANALLEEEFSKKARLKDLSNTLGLPIYDTFHFILPNENNIFIDLCNKKIKNGWKLSLRLMDLKEEQLLFRNLDINIKEVLSLIERLNKIETIKASIRPYKTPSVSGTLLINQSDVLLEIIFGPHDWLTKSPPMGVTIFRCWYQFPHMSVNYSTNNPQLRLTMYRLLKDVVIIVFNLEIHQLSEIEKSVYAEFIWHESLGYKFYECSFSNVWTDKR